MSKVKCITRHLLGYLSEIISNDINSLNNSWLVDAKMNLYKIRLYEDGYLISGGTEYPEELEKLPDDKSFTDLNLYLERVNRNQYVTSKNQIFKFSFNIKTTVYHYFLKNLNEEPRYFTDYVLTSKKRKRSYSNDYDNKLRSSTRVDIDWSKMVAASKVRNYLLGDTLIDWLQEYNVTSINQDVSKIIPNSKNKAKVFRDNDYTDEFTKHIMDQGITFEKEVIKILDTKETIVQASEAFQAKEIRNFEYTKKLMKEGVAIIYQAVLHNYEDKTYGCPDLLVRSDKINDIFGYEVLSKEELSLKKESLLGTKFYYVVVDIKHSTLHFNVDFETLRNKDSIPAYKGQLFVYNQALTRIQGFNINKAFILGKMWSYKDKTGTDFLKKLGVIDFNNFDSNYVSQTKDAIKWIQRVRTEGHNWVLSPTPSIPELYPNMNNERDGKWKSLKRELSEQINEITALWMCGVKNRIIAHGNNVTSFKDPECTANTLGFKSGKIHDTLNQIIDINRSLDEQVCPSKIKTDMICGKNWRNIHEESLEFYLDYETMNSNLGHIIIEDNNIGYQDNQFIFQIGVGYIKNKKWTYKSFIAPTKDLLGEIIMINKFWDHIEKVKKEEKKDKEHFVHWYNAEPISYHKLQNRVKNIGSVIKNKDFLDLYKLFKEEPITVNGSLNFSLKSVAKAMNKHKLIKTNWNSNNPCSNGLNAMLLAHKAYKESKGNLDETNVIMNNIVHYNQVDCKVLWEIITYLRENQ